MWEGVCTTTGCGWCSGMRLELLDAQMAGNRHEQGHPGHKVIECELHAPGRTANAVSPEEKR
jgi:hypothetical protein